MTKTGKNVEKRIGFNKLRKKLPHRYSTAIAETLTDITPVQVKCVFNGQIKNPVIVKRVYEAAILLAEDFAATRRLVRRVVPRKVQNNVNN
jgi:hypothetical protein